MMWIFYVTVLMLFFSGEQFVSGTVTVGPTITGPSSVIEGEGVTLKCSATCSNGSCQYSWTGFGLSSPVNIQTRSLGAVHRNASGQAFICNVEDNNKLPKSATKTLDVYYGPSSVSISIGPSKTVVEETTTDSLNIICTAPGCNPECTKFNWTLNDKSVSTVAKLFPTNRKISRNDAGTYECWADNGKVAPKKATTSITVHYAPKVVLSWNPFSKIFTCTASGNPSTYRFESLVHSVGSVSVRNLTLSKNGGRATYTISNPTYQDSGIYKCYASNDVTDLNTKTKLQVDSADVKINDEPVLIRSYESYNVSKGERLSIEIVTYANPRVKTVLIRTNNISLACDQQSENISLQCRDTNVQLRFHGKTVTRSGQSIIVEFTKMKEEYFKAYTFDVINGMGNFTTNVTLYPEGPPDAPLTFYKSEHSHESITFILETGFFNGGGQTLVVEQKLPGNQSSWTNATSEYAGNVKNQQISLTIRDLSESTAYEFRAYSFNEYGRSDYTEAVMTKTDEEPTSGAVIAGSIVGGLAVLAIIIGVIVAIVLYRRRKKGAEIDDGTLVQKNKDLTLQMPSSPGYVNQPMKDEEPVSPDSDSKGIYVNTSLMAGLYKPLKEENNVQHDLPKSTGPSFSLDSPGAHTNAIPDRAWPYDSPPSKNNGTSNPHEIYSNVESEITNTNDGHELYDTPRPKDFLKPVAPYDSPRSWTKTSGPVPQYDHPRSQQTNTLEPTELYDRPRAHSATTRSSPVELYDEPRPRGASESHRGLGKRRDEHIPSYLDIQNPDAVEEAYLNVDQSKELLNQSSSKLSKPETVAEEPYLEMNVVENIVKGSAKRESPYYNTQTSESYENTDISANKAKVDNDYQNMSGFKKQTKEGSNGKLKSSTVTKDYQNVAKYKKQPAKKQPSVDSQSELYMDMDKGTDRKSVVSIPDYQAPPPPPAGTDVLEEDYMNIEVKKKNKKKKK